MAISLGVYPIFRHSYFQKPAANGRDQSEKWTTWKIWQVGKEIEQREIHDTDQKISGGQKMALENPIEKWGVFLGKATSGDFLVC